MYPLIQVDLGKLRENAAYLADVCHKAGIQYYAVTKAVCAQPDIVAALEDVVDGFADSRLQNLARIKTDKPKLLLRIGDPTQARDIVRLSDISLQSEILTLHALSDAAQALNKEHKVVLMVDLGDLREGVMYTDREAILRTAQTVKDLPGLILHGVGVNLTCFGGIIPEEENLGRLVEIAQWLREELDLPIPMVSGGNSSSVGLLLHGGVPEGINHLRIGEAMLLDSDTATGEPFGFLHRDVFTVQAVLGEVQTKPSQPIGPTGPNAFGERVSFPDLGPMRRGIALIGRQDIDAEGLIPRDMRITVLGASSDHLIVDLTAASGYEVGSVVEFGVTYGSLLKAYTSPYLDKVSVNP